MIQLSHIPYPISHISYPISRFLLIHGKKNPPQITQINTDSAVAGVESSKVKVDYQ